MDIWKFYDITHTDHIICNPSNPEKFARLVDRVRLPEGAKVLEVACGKAELLALLAEKYSPAAVGIDASPHCIRAARARLAARVPGADITLLEMDGAHYRPGAAESFDLTVCLGASWIFNGHRGTLEALRAWTRPNGQIAVGEPYWRQDPDPEYLRRTGFAPDMFATHYQNVVAGQELGLELLYTLDSSHDDWDVYEGLQWTAGENYALVHPEDPDVPELLSRIRREKQDYLHYGRDAVGWAIYLFRK